MVLASPDMTNLDRLAQLADKIIEVATPLISTVTHLTSKFNQFCAEIADINHIIESLRIKNYCQLLSSHGCTLSSSGGSMEGGGGETLSPLKKNFHHFPYYLLLQLIQYHLHFVH